MEFSAQPRNPGGGLGRTYELEIFTNAQAGVSVREYPVSILPACCVERHINPNATFCLSYDSQKPIEDIEQAHSWWHSLETYLRNQDFASRRRVWPLSAGLSHGEHAAEIQLKMEEIAEPLAWKDEVLRSIFAGEGWLSGKLPRRSQDRSTLVNVRTACPRGCRRLHGVPRKEFCHLSECHSACKKMHKPILRADCPQRAQVETLVLLEHQRRQREEEMLRSLIKSGVTCCETMDRCPIRDLQA